MSGEELDELEALYSDLHQSMVRLGYLLTGSLPVAEEIAQDAFLQLWDKWDRVSQPASYLRRIVVNLTRKHHRRREVERRHAPLPPGPVLPPEVDETWAVLWRLGYRQRTALALRYYADLDIAGVADAMGCRQPAARSLIHRGLEAFRRELEDGEPENQQ